MGSLITVAQTVAGAPASWADDNSTSAAAGSVWLNWLNQKDSYGLTAWQYNLRVSQGGVTDPATELSAWLLGQFWDIYRLAVEVIVWAMGFVLEFKFLGLVREPANVVATVMQNTLDQLHIVGAIAVISVLMSTVWILKGRTGAGFGEMGVTMVVTALLGTAVARPVTFVTGPAGLLATAQNLGTSITANLLAVSARNHGGGASTNAQTEVTQRMLDVFIRTPQQLLNFGMTFDGPSTSKACAAAYNAAMHGGSVNPMKTACPKVVSATMSSPQDSLIGIPVVSIAIAFTAIFVLVLLLGTAFLTALAAFEAAKFLLDLVKSIFPGSSRGGVFQAAATIAVAAGLMVLAIVGVGIFALALIAVFDQSNGWNIVVIYLVIDITVAVMVLWLIFTIFKARKHGKRLGHKAAQAISPRPVSMPSGRKLGLNGPVTAKMAGRAGQAGSALARGSAQGAGQLARSAPGAAKKLARGASKAGVLAASATVGAPVAAPKAAAAVKNGFAFKKAAFDNTVSMAKGAYQARRAATSEYGQQWVRNMATAGAFLGKIGQPAQMPKRGVNSAQRMQDLRRNLGQPPVPGRHRATTDRDTTPVWAKGFPDSLSTKPTGSSGPTPVRPSVRRTPSASQRYTRPSFGSSADLAAARRADMQHRLSTIPKASRPNPRAASWKVSS